MTRFIMSLDEAVDLVLFAFEHGESGDILVQKAFHAITPLSSIIHFCFETVKCFCFCYCKFPRARV